MRLISLLLTLLLFSSHARAAESLGVSCFACSAFNQNSCTEFLKVFNGLKVPRLVILWRTFAEPNKDTCVQKFLDKYKSIPHDLYIHPQNGPGLRNRRLAPYEFWHGQTVAQLNQRLESGDAKRELRREIRKIVRWTNARSNQNTRVVISTGLEDNWTNRAYQTVVRTIRAAIPDAWQILRNPVGRYENRYDTRGADFIELHAIFSRFIRASKRAGRCVFNNDGYDLDLGDAEGLLPNVPLSSMRFVYRQNRRDNCDGFIWWSGPQGIEFQRFIRPRERNFRIHSKSINTINGFLRSFEK